MKRPFAVIGFTYLAALMAALFLGAKISVAVSGVCTALFAVSLAIKNIRRKAFISIMLMTSAVAMMSFSIFVSVCIEPAVQLSGSQCTITAVVCEEPYESNGKYYYPLEVNKIDGLDISGFKLLASSSYVYDADVYDELNAKISLYQGDDLIFANYDISRGYFLRGSIYHFDGVSVKHNDSKPIYYYAVELRRIMKDTIKEYLPDKYADLMLGIMLGDKHSISLENREAFSSVGVSHLISVSGFHVTVIAQLFLIIFTALFGGRKRFGAIGAIIAVFLFMAVTGFSPTVIRAGIMQIIFLFGLIFFKSPDPLNSLGFSVMIMCLFNPYIGADFGFLMSVGATVGIFIYSDRIKNYIIEKFQRKELHKHSVKMEKHHVVDMMLKRLISGFASTAAATISATIFTLPITIVVFKQFPLYTVLANFLVAYPSSIMLTLGIVGILFHFTWIFSFLSYPIMLGCGIIGKYIIFCVEHIAELPLSVIRLNYSFIFIWLAAMAIVFVLSYWCRKRRFAVRFTAVVSVVSLLVTIAVYNVYCSFGTSIYIAESGDGINIAVSSDSNTSLITYGGSKAYDMYDYLDTSSINEIEYLLIGETSTYDTVNAEYILKNYDVQNIGIYNEDKAREKLSRLLGDSTIKYDNSRKNNADLGVYSITSIETQSGVFTHCVFSEDFDILIVPNGGDALQIPNEWLNSSVCVLCEIPKNHYLLNPAAVVLSCDKENASEFYGRLSEICEDIYMTCFENNIRLRLSDGGNISIWSEDNWLS